MGRHMLSVRLALRELRAGLSGFRIFLVCLLLGVAAIAILSNGLVHARQPREVAGMLTGVLLILALSSSVVPKLISNWRARRKAAS